MSGRRAARVIEALRLLRDGTEIAAPEVGEGEFADEEAAPPLLQAPALQGHRLTTPGGAVELPADALAAVDESAPAGTLRLDPVAGSMDRPDEVHLSWTEPYATQGLNAKYTLERRFEDNRTTISTAWGRRGAPTLQGFDVVRDGVPIASLGTTERAFTDKDASAATPYAIKAFTATDQAAGFSLSWTIEPSNPYSLGPMHDYEVVPRTDDGESLAGKGTGQRMIARTSVELYRDGERIDTPIGSTYGRILPEEERPRLETPSLEVEEERDGEVLLRWGDPELKGMRRNRYQLVVHTTAGELRSAEVEAGALAPKLQYFYLYRNGQFFRSYNEPARRTALVPAAPGSVTSVSLRASEGTVEEGVDLDWDIDAQPGAVEEYAISLYYSQQGPVETARPCPPPTPVRPPSPVSGR